MKKLLNTRQLSLFWKAFLSYAPLVIIPSIIFGLYIHLSYGEMIRSSVDSESRNTLRSVQTQNEALIGRMQNIVDCISTEAELGAFRFEEAPNRALPLIRKLKQYHSVTNEIAEMYLKYNIDDYLYSSSTSVQLPLLLEHMRYEKITPDELRDMLSTPGAVFVLPDQKGSGLLASGTRSVTYILPLSHLFVQNGGQMMFQINDSFYRNMLDYEVQRNQNLYMIQNGEIVLQRENVMFSDDLRRELLGQMEGGEAVTQLYAAGQSYNVYWLHSGMLSMTYALAVPDQQFNQLLVQRFLPFLFLMLVVLALMMVIFTLLTRRNLSPITQLSMQFTLASQGRNEIAIIHDGVQQLQKRNADLSEQMAQDMPGRRSNFVRSFLANTFPDDEARRLAAHKAQIDDSPRQYAVVIVAYSQHERRRINLRDVERLLVSERKGAVSDIVRDGTVVALLFCEDGNVLMHQLESKLAQIHQVYPMVIFAVSKAHADAADAYYAYLEAMHAYEGRFIRGNRELLRFDQMMQAGDEQAEYPQRLIDRLDRALQERDEDVMEHALNALSDYLRNIPISLYMFRRVYHDIVNVLIKRYQNLVLDHNGQPVFDPFSLTDCLSLEEMDQMLRNTCRRILRQASDDAGGGDALTAQAQMLLQAQFSDPNMSISQVAEAIGLPDAKLNALFKAEIGITPNDYLMQLRMKHARMLLRNTEEPVKDIAVQCGYYGVSAFIRRFKKYTGVTPVQYRNNRED